MKVNDGVGGFALSKISPMFHSSSSSEGISSGLLTSEGGDSTSAPATSAMALTVKW